MSTIHNEGPSLRHPETTTMMPGDFTLWLKVKLMDGWQIHPSLEAPGSWNLYNTVWDETYTFQPSEHSGYQHEEDEQYGGGFGKKYSVRVVTHL